MQRRDFTGMAAMVSPDTTVSSPLAALMPFRLPCRASINADVKRLTSTAARTDVLVVTPGRLLELLAHCALAPRLEHVRGPVFDEADRLNVGFRVKIAKIMEFPPRVRRPADAAFLGDRRWGDQAGACAALVRDDYLTPPQIAVTAFRPDHQFVSTLLEDGVNMHEHGMPPAAAPRAR